MSGTMRGRAGGRSGRLVSACFMVSAVTLLAGALAAGCARPPALSQTFSSEAALAERILGALAARDIAALQALPLSEDEFRDVVWPELPASRPEARVPLDYAWRTLAQNSRGHLHEAVHEHGGRRYRLLRVRFDGGSTPYGSFTVHRRARVVVRDAAGGERQLRLFGSVLEHDRRFKLFSFVAD